MSIIEVLEQFGVVRRLINRLGIIYLKNGDLGPKQMLLLRFVHKQKQCTMGTISAGIGSDKASVTRMVSSLVKAKYLERIYSKQDRRETMVSLGPYAKAVIPEIERIYGKLAADFSGALSVSEKATLLTILKKIEPRLQQAIDVLLKSSPESDD